jgi:isopentenyl-diphosphate delta-isomerase
MTDYSIITEMDEPCILKDDNKEIGSSTFVDCHTIPTKCHSAFSLFLFNEEDELLIQQRSKNKILYPLYWSNTVSNHKVTENTEDILIRLNYETNLNLKIKLIKFLTIKYNSNYNGIYGENEIHEIYFGICDIKKEKLSIPNLDEVVELKFVHFDDLVNLTDSTDQLVTPWFRAIIKQFKSLNSKYYKS